MVEISVGNLKDHSVLRDRAENLGIWALIHHNACALGRRWHRHLPYNAKFCMIRDHKSRAPIQKHLCPKADRLFAKIR